MSSTDEANATLAEEGAAGQFTGSHNPNQALVVKMDFQQTTNQTKNRKRISRGIAKAHKKTKMRVMKSRSCRGNHECFQSKTRGFFKKGTSEKSKPAERTDNNHV